MPSEGFVAAVLEKGKRERNTARNRAAILRAARDAFCEIGFDATTVRDIIRRTEFATDLSLGGIERMIRKA